MNEVTLTQVLFQCPLCGEEYVYFAEANNCVHNHILSWSLVQTELDGNLGLNVDKPILIGSIKDTLIKKIKLVMYEIDQYGMRKDIVYETTVGDE